MTRDGLARTLVHRRPRGTLSGWLPSMAGQQQVRSDIGCILGGGDMVERNAAVVRQAVEHIWNRGDLDMADNLFDSAYVNHGGLIPDLVHGPEAIKMSVALYRTAFPGLSIAIDSVVADGDSVELRWTAHGTSRDLPLSAGPGSQSETLSGTTRSRLSDGQIVESWTTWDREDVLRHLASSEHSDHRPGG